VIITANHDRLKLCQDREVPEWANKLSQQIIKGTGYTKEKGALCSIPSPVDACDTPSRQNLPWPLPLPALPLHIYHDTILCTPCTWSWTPQYMASDKHIITANHNWLKLCQDREVPEWAQNLSQQIIEGTGYTKEKGGVKDQRGYRAKLVILTQSPWYHSLHSSHLIMNSPVYGFWQTQ
jgi:hypothetical protein